MEDILRTAPFCFMQLDMWLPEEFPPEVSLWELTICGWEIKPSKTGTYETTFVEGVSEPLYQLEA